MCASVCWADVQVEEGRVGGQRRAPNGVPDDGRPCSPGSRSGGFCSRLGSCLCSVTQQMHFSPLVFGKECGRGANVWAAELLRCGGPRQLESGGESPGMFLEPTLSYRRGLRRDSQYAGGAWA